MEGLLLLQLFNGNVQRRESFSWLVVSKWHDPSGVWWELRAPLGFCRGCITQRRYRGRWVSQNWAIVAAVLHNRWQSRICNLLLCTSLLHFVKTAQQKLMCFCRPLYSIPVATYESAGLFWLVEESDVWTWYSVQDVQGLFTSTLSIWMQVHDLKQAGSS